jgi:hypothetical protein
MIRFMSLRSLWFVVGLACMSCGGTQESDPNEPQTAKQKQALEAKNSGEADKASTKWGGWRYQGDRKECFYVVGRHCYKTENAACQAAHCKAPKKCDSVGGGPATVSCK